MISWYHGALRFLTGCKPLTHHCTLYFLAGPRWPYAGWFTGIIYKSICDLLPAYISDYMLHKHLSHSLQSLHYIHRSISLYRTWKTGFSFSAPCSWKTLQKDLQLSADFTCRCKRRSNDPVKSSLGTYSCFWHDCVNITLLFFYISYLIAVVFLLSFNTFVSLVNETSSLNGATCINKGKIKTNFVI